MKNKSICFLLGGMAFTFLLAFLVIQLNDRYIYRFFNQVIYALKEVYPNAEIDMVKILNGDENIPDYLTEYGINAQTIHKLSIYQNFRYCIIVLVLSFFMIVSLLFFMMYYFRNKKIKKEITIINRYLQDILNDQYELNIAGYNEDEMSILKNDIYKVTIKLKEYSLYEQKEQKFLMNTLEDISHQLKTPLTALMITNDIMIHNDLTEEERHSFLEKEAKELERMQWLITTLLKLSKLDSGTVVFKKEKVLVNHLIDEALFSLNTVMETKEIQVVKKNLDFYLFCDVLWIREALTNILKNAYEHSLDKGKIIIEGEDNPIYQAILITDYGVGIPKKDIKNIFKRFYSTNLSKNSMGIGLNMARIIVEKHHGKIEVESVVGKFTTFKIIFMKNSC